MSVSGAVPAFGFKFQRGDTSGPTGFIDIGEVTSVGRPKFTKVFKDVTHHASPENVQEQKPVLVNITAFPVKINMKPSDPNTALLYADAKSLVVRYYQVLYPDGTHYIRGPGSIDMGEEGDAPGDIIGATINCTPTGVWTTNLGT